MRPVQMDRGQVWVHHKFVCASHVRELILFLHNDILSTKRNHEQPRPRRVKRSRSMAGRTYRRQDSPRQSQKRETRYSRLGRAVGGIGEGCERVYDAASGLLRMLKCAYVYDDKALISTVLAAAR